eukprot:COSAG05_NODE_723_length_7727_cov_19.327871_7_plen_75_part_00
MFVVFGFVWYFGIYRYEGQRHGLPAPEHVKLPESWQVCVLCHRHRHHLHSHRLCAYSAGPAAWRLTLYDVQSRV